MHDVTLNMKNIKAKKDMSYTYSSMKLQRLPNSTTKTLPALVGTLAFALSFTHQCQPFHFIYLSTLLSRVAMTKFSNINALFYSSNETKNYKGRYLTLKAIDYSEEKITSQLHFLDYANLQ